jgi:hypothetical protein
MTSFRQLEANRRNARLSTGPVTEQGKRKSRQNAVRHGLTAETVIDALEDAEDYAAFEMAVTADYDAPSVVERELVLRLASLLWRLRRATAIESGLFKIQAKHLLQFRQRRQAHEDRQKIIDTIWTLCRGIKTSLPAPSSLFQSRHEAINPTTSHAPSFASRICRPVPSTGSAGMRSHSGVRPVRSCSPCNVSTAEGHGRE